MPAYSLSLAHFFVFSFLVLSEAQLPASGAVAVSASLAPRPGGPELCKLLLATPEVQRLLDLGFEPVVVASISKVPGLLEELLSHPNHTITPVLKYRGISIGLSEFNPSYLSSASPGTWTGSIRDALKHGDRSHDSDSRYRPEGIIIEMQIPKIWDVRPTHMEARADDETCMLPNDQFPQPYVFMRRLGVINMQRRKKLFNEMRFNLNQRSKEDLISDVDWITMP